MKSVRDKARRRGTGRAVAGEGGGRWRWGREPLFANASPSLQSYPRHIARLNPHPTPAAEGITGELQRNRETLTRIRGNVGVVSGSLDQARRILRSMSRREVRTKIAVAVFAVCMLAIIGGMIYWVSQKKDAAA